MLEKLLSKRNMYYAYRQVMSNNGAPGVDHMPLSQLMFYLTRNWDETKTQIEEGKYLPSAIRGKEISKGEGKTRLLGIPTVLDRLIQQGMYQVLMPLFDKDFSEHSYGFRPRKNAHQALESSLS